MITGIPDSLQEMGPRFRGVYYWRPNKPSAILHTVEGIKAEIVGPTESSCTLRIKWIGGRQYSLVREPSLSNGIRQKEETH